MQQRRVRLPRPGVRLRRSFKSLYQRLSSCHRRTSRESSPLWSTRKRCPASRWGRSSAMPMVRGCWVRRIAAAAALYGMQPRVRLHVATLPSVWSRQQWLPRSPRKNQTRALVSSAVAALVVCSPSLHWQSADSRLRLFLALPRIRHYHLWKSAPSSARRAARLFRQSQNHWLHRRLPGCEHQLLCAHHRQHPRCRHHHCR